MSNGKEKLITINIPGPSLYFIVSERFADVKCFYNKIKIGGILKSRVYFIFKSFHNLDVFFSLFSTYTIVE